MEGNTILASQTLAAVTSSSIATLITLIPHSTNIISLQINSTLRSNGNGGIDANGLSSIIIGVIGLCITAASLISGWKVWKRFSQRMAKIEDVESKPAYSEKPASSTDTFNSNIVTINFSVLNINISPPLVKSLDLAIIHPDKTPGTGGSEDIALYKASTELGYLLIPGTLLAWPQYKRPG